MEPFVWLGRAIIFEMGFSFVAMPHRPLGFGPVSICSIN
jgi:hypothetical protein